MSQQNVEIVQGFYDDLNRGDLASVLEKIDPGFEWRQRNDAPENDLILGPEGFKGQWESIVDVLVDFRQESKEFIVVGDQVVVPVFQVGRGRASGVSIEQHEVHVFGLRSGMLVELREYHSKDEALKDVNLAG